MSLTKEDYVAITNFINLHVKDAKQGRYNPRVLIFTLGTYFSQYEGFDYDKWEKDCLEGVE